MPLPQASDVQRELRLGSVLLQQGMDMVDVLAVCLRDPDISNVWLQDCKQGLEKMLAKAKKKRPGNGSPSVYWPAL